jgi:hypothetical protein
VIKSIMSTTTLSGFLSETQINSLSATGHQAS